MAVILVSLIKQAKLFIHAMSRQMVFRNTFGGMTEDERLDEIRTVVEQDLQQINLDHIDQLEEVKGVLVENFPDINSLFRHYSAYTMNSSTACMNFSEFCKVVQDAEIYHTVNDRQLLVSVFNQSNLEADADKDNPDAGNWF